MLESLEKKETEGHSNLEEILIYIFEHLSRNSKLIDIEKLSEIVDLPVYTLRQLALNGIIPSYRITRKRYLFDPNEVIIHIKENYKMHRKSA